MKAKQIDTAIELIDTGFFRTARNYDLIFFFFTNFERTTYLIDTLQIFFFTCGIQLKN